MTAPQFKEGQRLELTTHRRQIKRLQRWLVLVSLLAALAAAAGAIGFFSARSAIGRINDERAQNVERNCADVNARNRASSMALDRLLAERSADASPEQIRRSRASTKVLIDNLVPRRDCAALARQQVTNP